MKNTLLKLLSLLLCLGTLLSAASILSACKDKSEKNNVEFTVIAENGESQYTIIRPEKAKADELNVILDIRRHIIDACGIEMKVSNDWTNKKDDIDPDAKEILVGNTNRPESREVLESLEPNSWAVVNKGNKIVICANNKALLSDKAESFGPGV